MPVSLSSLSNLEWSTQGNGFSGIKKVVYNAYRLLKKNGVFILEIAHNQSNEVRSILMSKNFYVIKTSKDLSGKNRCIVSLKIK